MFPVSSASWSAALDSTGYGRGDTGLKQMNEHTVYPQVATGKQGFTKVTVHSPTVPS